LRWSRKPKLRFYICSRVRTILCALIRWSNKTKSNRTRFKVQSQMERENVGTLEILPPWLQKQVVSQAMELHAFVRLLRCCQQMEVFLNVTTCLLAIKPSQSMRLSYARGARCIDNGLPWLQGRRGEVRPDFKLRGVGLPCKKYTQR